MQFQGTYGLPEVCALDPNLRHPGLDDLLNSFPASLSYKLHSSIFPNIMESEDQMSNFGFSSSGFVILGTHGVVVKKKRKDNGIERILLLNSILCPREAKCLILKSVFGCISSS